MACPERDYSALSLLFFHVSRLPMQAGNTGAEKRRGRAWVLRVLPHYVCRAAVARRQFGSVWDWLPVVAGLLASV